ncbi:thymidine kinase [Peptostreptococcus equinus]|uniref:Thymidine kinase n=1 Tax=Peptostreptococcus equinus TaxID=3003601 RepID=A0ABY7JQT5_9FIRM|nr:thymidine kinase [Peptostreptococcus sp. CBA3647]WAW15718.1 thymidine kinase [Peptostreptococcus sp. CBA3647]
MAKLYFYYGVMGSSKTANALMVHYNYHERGKKALLVKTDLDTRDGISCIKSRIGLEHECELLSSFINYDKDRIKDFDCIIVDEIQFASKEEIDFLSDIVDNLSIPVLCYGLRADFRNILFEGSERLITLADEIHEVKTVCWCGAKATCNARYNENGIVRQGEQIELGANDKYIALCRKHYKEGKLER